MEIDDGQPRSDNPRSDVPMPTRFRAEQVGSLLRPPELLAARTRYAISDIPFEELKQFEDQAIVSALERQRSIGLDVLTDGEFRRGSWLSHMADSVEGFVPVRVTVEWKGPSAAAEGSTARAVGGKLRKLRQLTRDELPLLKQAARNPFKITLPAPSNFVVASYKAGLTDKVYATHSELLRDLADVIRDEVLWLTNEGVRYIQFDAPFYSHYLDPHHREQLKAAGFDPDEEFDLAIAADNAAMGNIPRTEITFALHVCRGNSRSRWYAEGGYDQIAEKLFGSLDVDTFLLEYDTQRSGGFEPLRLVPHGKTVVLGLITSKDPVLESQDQLRRRIDEAARYFPIENLALSPQCGFASVAAGNLVTTDAQWRKLELVVDTARRVWNQ